VQSRPQIESGPAALVAQTLKLRTGPSVVAGAQCDFLVAIVSMSLSRWLPQRSFPPYAYLPGRNPHPVRDPTGHSYHVGPLPVATEASLGSDAFLWGLNLFNHGYYWEAHEAWEGLWHVGDRDNPLRVLFKSLILLSAAGVKVRERKMQRLRITPCAPRLCFVSS
jgi:Domain of unknown function (DUF309)